jgi:hypothetical protein
VVVPSAAGIPARREAVPGHDVISLPAEEVVVSATGRVAARIEDVADKLVVAYAAIDVIVCGSPDESVLSGEPADQVIPAEAIDEVVASGADDDVVGFGTDQAAGVRCRFAEAADALLRDSLSGAGTAADQNEEDGSSASESPAACIPRTHVLPSLGTSRLLLLPGHNFGALLLGRSAGERLEQAAELLHRVVVQQASVADSCHSELGELGV